MWGLRSRVPSRDENEEDKVIFKGWARMALPLQAFNVVEVRKPNVGQNKPASVKADILLDTKRTPLFALSSAVVALALKCVVELKKAMYGDVSLHTTGQASCWQEPDEPPTVQTPCCLAFPEMQRLSPKQCRVSCYAFQRSTAIMRKAHKRLVHRRVERGRAQRVGRDQAARRAVPADGAAA